MDTPVEGPIAEQSAALPRQPLGHLSRLGSVLSRAEDVEGIVRSVLHDLAALPQVVRVGLALVEGGGRRLTFVASDRDLGGALPWCHIDAYDDVPLTTVVRTGQPVFGLLEDLRGRYPDMVAAELERATAALAALPLPGAGSPIGGLLIGFDTPQAFAVRQVQLLEATARRTAEALRRVRALRNRRLEPTVASDKPVEAAARATITLEDDPRAAAVARTFLRDRLRAWGVDGDLADSAQLCLSEIVTNAYLHAGTPCEVEASLQDRVLSVLVRDHGGQAAADAAPVAEPDPMRVHGRGLQLVEALSHRWGSERDADGMTVWFVLELDGAPDLDADWGSRTG